MLSPGYLYLKNSSPNILKSEACCKIFLPIGSYWPVIAAIDQLTHNKIVQTIQKYTYNNLVTTSINIGPPKKSNKNNYERQQQISQRYINGSGNNNNDY